VAQHEQRRVVATEHVAGRADQALLPKVLIAASIFALPALQPRGPGHLTPADFVMAAGLIGVVLWARTYRIKVHAPYAIPIGILILTGMFAALFGIAPQTGLLSAVQESFLLAWAAAIATLCGSPKNLSMILSTWAWTATVWASVLAGAVVSHQWWLAGVQSLSGARAQLAFDNPNMAADYFLLSFFVVLISRYPRHRLARAYAYLVIAAALVFTGSNAALLSLGLGVAVAGFVGLWRRADMVSAVAVSAVAGALLIGVTYIAAESGMVENLQNSSNVLIQRSVARGPKSAAGRQTLYNEEFQLYRTGSLLGRGPASTKASLGSSLGEIVKEAHDDYLATLIERGAIGVIGLIILIGAVGVRAFYIAMRPLAPAYSRLIARPSLVLGAVVALAATSATHEILHYRHVWALFGILGGVFLYGRRTSTSPEPQPGS
jgi:O-antigen ligase